MPALKPNEEFHAICRVDPCPSPEFEKPAMKVKSLTTGDIIEKPVRRVSFYGRVYVREVLHLCDYDEDEHRKTWYSRDEIEEIKESIFETVRRIANGGHQEDSKEHCARGLEHRSKSGALQRRKNKLLALQLVLDEQQDQKESGINHPETLARVYQEISSQSIIAAQRIGKKDEIEVHGDRGNGRRRSLLAGQRNGMSLRSLRSLGQF